jgi:hypothetical protein
MDITILKPFTYNGVALVTGQAVNIPDADALFYISAGKAIQANQQMFTFPELVRELQVADVGAALGLPQFAYDASGNVTGLTGPGGNVISFGGPSYTFSGKPTASASNAGMSVRITDVGPAGFGSIWCSDGTKWSPLNGFVNLFKNTGTVASPLATLSNANNTKYTLPAANGVTSGGSLLIPAYLLAQGRTIRASAKMRYRGGTGSWTVAMRLGTNDSGSDPAIATQSGPATNLDDLFLIQEAEVTSSTSMVTSGILTPNQPVASQHIDRTSNFNVAQPMYIGIYGLAINAADNVDLISYRIDLIG